MHHERECYQEEKVSVVNLFEIDIHKQSMKQVASLEASSMLGQMSNMKSPIS